MSMQIEPTLLATQNRIPAYLQQPREQLSQTTPDTKAAAPVATAAQQPHLPGELAGEAQQALAAFRTGLGGTANEPESIHNLDADRVARLLNFDDI